VKPVKRSGKRTSKRRKSRMYLGFTGHRDCFVPEQELDKLREKYPNYVWLHGGAKGFDTQVCMYANKHGIRQSIIPPDYRKYFFMVAPLKRNEVIVDRCNLLVACYDGREKGGTFYTIEYAHKQGKPVEYLTPIKGV
jgi:hypothetical protein